MQTFRPTRALRSIALAAAVSGLLAACGGGGEPTSAAVPGGSGGEATADAGPGAVSIERSRFAPTDVTIAAGTTVEFVNLDAFDHTVTSTDDGTVPFDSGSFGQDETFTQQFDDAGTYDYFCQIHPTMRASVTVV